jgi:hypothetical protein
MSTFDDIRAQWQKEHHERSEAAKLALRHHFQNRPEIACVFVEFDGYDDSGACDSITFVDINGVELVADVLKNAVEEYVIAILPDGWEIDDGSYGIVEVDMATSQATVKLTRRICQEYTETFEV